MTKQEEIKIVKQFTQATDEQIMINETGWTSHFILDVLSFNTRAIRFYLAHGYKKVADRQVRLGDKEYPLTVMRKKMIEQMKFEFMAKAQPSENCAWHFYSFPKELAKEIRELFRWKEEGWGRMKATIKIGNTEWKTSIWFDTKQDTYWFPIKAAIRKKENIEDDKDIKVSVWL